MKNIRPIADSELSNLMLMEYYILWEVRDNLLIFKNSFTGKELVVDNNEVQLKDIKVNGLYWIS